MSSSRTISAGSGDRHRSMRARPRLLVDWAGALRAAQLVAVDIADRPGGRPAADPPRQARLGSRRRGRGVRAHAPGSLAGSIRQVTLFEAHTGEVLGTLRHLDVQTLERLNV